MPPFLAFNIGSAIRLSTAYIMSILGTCLPHLINTYLILCKGFGWALPVPNEYFQSTCLTAPFHTFNIGSAIRLSAIYIMSILGTCPPHPINTYLILCKGFGWALPVPNEYFQSIHLMAPFHTLIIGLAIRLSIAYIMPILGPGFGWALPVPNEY